MEENQQNYTVWQRLSKAFGPNSLLNQDYPTYKLDKEVLLKTDDKAEYEKQKLQAQQTMYLAGQWAKIENNLYTQAVYYEPTRLASFYDFESMEFTPEISAALDIYAEESTTSDQNGHMLQIYSESKRIRNILADLFNNALDLNTNLPMWIRNVCKFGDNFIYLKLDPEKGVVGCMQFPNIEIERLERGMAAKSMNAEIDPKQKGLRFHWKTKDIEFNAWEVAHFRLLGDDRKLPYGTSMLEKARRIWKQLCVSENTEVWTEMGYKKIKDLAPGEIIYSYDYDNNKLIPTPIKDCWQSGIKKTYNIRTRYNSIDVTDDHQVLVYNNGEFFYKTLNDFIIDEDYLVNPQLDDVRYEKIIDITENEPEAVWDLEVESELHNFIANGSVVHNCLAEDAMLIYRTSRAPERRVFKVFVGNMDDKDVEPYVQRVANKFKRDQVVDGKTGNVDMRFNQMAVDQDYFIPVRDPAQASPIETLPGAQNLSEIADIEYIQKKLVTALRIPKAYLGFEEALGDGKNLSLLDIRFARTINKIQKSVLGELNKIAIIHLFLLGFEDELSNFTLGLTNPSKQADLLMVEVWKEKVALYKELVNEVPKSLQPTSATWAKKHIFGFSDDEIKLDVQQIRLERAISAELDNTATIITRTGIFDTVDKLYKTTSGSTETPPAEGGVPPMGDMGAPPPMDMPPPPPGGDTLPENKMNDNLNLLLENDDILGDSYLDLGKARNSLGSIEKELAKILKD
jgi:hypothetical protein